MDKEEKHGDIKEDNSKTAQEDFARRKSAPTKDENLQRRRFERIVTVVLVAVALIIPIWGLAESAYVNSLSVGRGYDYFYHVRVINVNSNFTLIVPIPVLDNGIIVQGRDFEDWQLGDLEVVDTERGPGLMIRSEGPISLAFNWDYDALRESSDRVSDGCPLPSLTELDEDRGVVCSSVVGDSTGMAWIWSDVDGLVVKIQFERWWGTLRTWEGFLLPVNEPASCNNNGGLHLSGDSETVDGWTNFSIDLDFICETV